MMKFRVQLKTRTQFVSDVIMRFSEVRKLIKRLKTEKGLKMSRQKGRWPFEHTEVFVFQNETQYVEMILGGGAK